MCSIIHNETSVIISSLAQASNPLLLAKLVSSLLICLLVLRVNIASNKHFGRVRTISLTAFINSLPFMLANYLFYGSSYIHPYMPLAMNACCVKHWRNERLHSNGTGLNPLYSYGLALHEWPSISTTVLYSCFVSIWAGNNIFHRSEQIVSPLCHRRYKNLNINPTVCELNVPTWRKLSQKCSPILYANYYFDRGVVLSMIKMSFW